MKNHIFSIGLLAALAISCSIHEMDFKDSYAFEEFYASIENAETPDTKVFATEELYLRWNADDRITIFNKYTYNQEYRFTGETGDNSGSFKKVDNGDFVTGNSLDNIYAIYPFLESTRISDTGVITVTLPAEQKYAENTMGLGANSMVSATTDNQLLFKNVGGYLMLKLYGDDVTVSSITLKGNNGERIAGKATVTMPVNGVPSVVMSETTGQEITLVCETPVKIGSTAETATKFWIVVPPTVFSKGFTLTVKDNKNRVFEKSTSKSLEIGRNKLARMSALFIDFGLPQPNNVIFYTSVDGNIIDPVTRYNDWGASIISNEYNDGHGTITFDGEVRCIGSAAFTDCSGLTSISLPNSVVEIGSCAFLNCSGLVAFQFPKNLTTIGMNAFVGCSSLSSITIPSSIMSIGDPNFIKCPALESIIVDSNNLLFDSRDGCNAIIETQSNTLLVGCKNTKIPDGITAIHNGAFHGCTGLTMINIPETVRRIEQYAFEDCSSLIDISIPEGITILDYSTFKGCTNLSSISLPETVTRIEGHAFEGCQSLSEIIIPHKTAFIGGYAFHDCKSLTSLRLPSTITTIGAYAFYFCNALTEITMTPSTPPAGNQSMFSVTGNCPIYVPAGSVEAYKSAQYWSDYADRIQAILSDRPSLKEFAQEFVKGLDIWETTIGTVESEAMHLIADGTAWENVHFIPITPNPNCEYLNHEGNQYDPKYTPWVLNIGGKQYSSSQAWEIAIRGLMNLVTSEGEAFLPTMDDRNKAYTLANNQSFSEAGMPNPSEANQWGKHPWYEGSDSDRIKYNGAEIETVDVNFMVKVGAWHVVRAFVKTAGNSSPLGMVGNVQEFGTTSGSLNLEGYAGYISPMRELLILMRIYKYILDNNIDSNVYTAIKDQKFDFDLYGIPFVPVPEAIDLGLSVKWASFNLGASAPEEYGDYYAWGETEPYYLSQYPLIWKEGKEHGYDWPSYKWCMGSYDTLTKYCLGSSYGYNGFTDTKIVLDPEDDAAHINLGGNWRMPTDTEMTELRENCTWEWTNQNGVNGYMVTGSNGNSIFLPAADYQYFANPIYSSGSAGYYWSLSLKMESSYPQAWIVHFDSSNIVRLQLGRCCGLSIRPICD